MKETRPIQYIYFDTSLAGQRSIEAFAEYAALADKTNHAMVELVFTPLILAELTGGTCFSKEDLISNTRYLPRNIEGIFRQYNKYIHVPKASEIDELHVGELFDKVTKLDNEDGIVGKVPTYDDMCTRISNYMDHNYNNPKSQARPLFQLHAGDASLVTHFGDFLHHVFGKIDSIKNGNNSIEFVIASNDSGLWAQARDTARRYNAISKLTRLDNKATTVSDWLRAQIDSIPVEDMNAETNKLKHGISALLMDKRLINANSDNKYTNAIQELRSANRNNANRTGK